MASIPEAGKPLTQREAEVLSAFRGGCATGKEVARKLGISHRTVEIHSRNAVVKLGVRNQMQAILVYDRAIQPQSVNSQKLAAALVFERGASLPNFALVPIAVVDFYSRETA